MARLKALRPQSSQAVGSALAFRSAHVAPMLPARTAKCSGDIPPGPLLMLFTPLSAEKRNEQEICDKSIQVCLRAVTMLVDKFQGLGCEWLPCSHRGRVENVGTGFVRKSELAENHVGKQLTGGVIVRIFHGLENNCGCMHHVVHPLV